MNFIKKHKTKIIIVLIIIAALAAAFFFGGRQTEGGPNTADNISDTAVSDSEQIEQTVGGSETGILSAVIGNSDAQPHAEEGGDNRTGAERSGESGNDEKKTFSDGNEGHSSAAASTSNSNMVSSSSAASDSHSEASSSAAASTSHGAEVSSDTAPAPVEPENAVITDKELTCTLSVRCDTAVKNKSRLTDGKAELLPSDGVIFAERTVTFYEGESVFNLLSREMKKNRIHLEFVNTPMYNSAYIEGIANLYEYDCGELSGWMYRVNGIFPSYGCSRYSLSEGDRVEWVYTCDLGNDVGKFE